MKPAPFSRRRVAFKLFLLTIFIATSAMASSSLGMHLTSQPLPPEWRLPEAKRSPGGDVRHYRV
jgi:hypothetical protein